MGHQLNSWGTFPRTVHGLTGIPLSPFLHGSFGHVVSNSIPFLVLGGLIALRGRQVLLRVSFIVIGLGGAGVWALGRPAIHIGASGLVFGYFGYLVARGWYERKLGSILMAIAVFTDGEAIGTWATTDIEISALHPDGTWLPAVTVAQGSWPVVAPEDPDTIHLFFNSGAELFYSNSQ